jgi:hypothetical protein
MKFIVLLLFIFLIIWLLSPTRENFFPFLTNPQLDDGDQFYIRTTNGEYVSVCYSCQPTGQNLYNKCSANLCIKDEPVKSSVYTYVKHRDGTFSVRTVNGKYWKRCSNCFESCPNIICGDGINPNLQPSKFELIKNGDGTVSIKTDTGRLLELQECEQSCGRIIAALGVGINKQFVIEKIEAPQVSYERDRKPTHKFVPPSYAPLIIPFQD